MSTLEELTPDSNPWVVVADLDENSTSGTPFMISRNVNETRLKAWTNEQEPLQNVGVGPYETPFGDQFLLLVRVGGGSDVLTERQLFWDLLNPNAGTNVILQP